MEQFCGSITNFRFALVVPAFFRGQVEEGTVTLVRGSVRRSFSFRNGELVSQSSTSPDEHLGRVLIELNLLAADRAAQVFDEARSAGLPLAQYAVENRLLSEPSAKAALQLKARRAFTDCYRWQSGEILFTPQAVIPDGISVGLSVAALHREALAQLDAGRARRARFDNPAEMIVAARSYLAVGDFEGAERALKKALELAALPEGQQLYRQAEEGCKAFTSHELGAMEGRLRVTHSLPAPQKLTAEDLLLYARLQSAGSLSDAIARSGLGTIQGYRSVKRLLEIGAVALEDSEQPEKLEKLA